MDIACLGTRQALDGVASGMHFTEQARVLHAMVDQLEHLAHLLDEAAGHLADACIDLLLHKL